jgi:hypothetical protein
MDIVSKKSDIGLEQLDFSRNRWSWGFLKDFIRGIQMFPVFFNRLREDEDIIYVNYGIFT